jgi:hypothetical protein
MSASGWQISSSSLRTLRGMIIDRDEGWRADSKWSEIIDAEIRKGIENIDEPTFNQVYWYLRDGGLPGSYETWGFNEEKMTKACRRYLKRHKVQLDDT